jgi:hypothetical protein
MAWEGALGTWLHSTFPWNKSDECNFFVAPPDNKTWLLILGPHNPDHKKINLWKSFSPLSPLSQTEHQSSVSFFLQGLILPSHIFPQWVHLRLTSWKPLTHSPWLLAFFLNLIRITVVCPASRWQLAKLQKPFTFLLPDTWTADSGRFCAHPHYCVLLWS